MLDALPSQDRQQLARGCPVARYALRTHCIRAPVSSEITRPASAQQKCAVSQLLERKHTAKCAQHWLKARRPGRSRAKHLQCTSSDWQMQINGGRQIIAPCTSCKHDMRSIHFPSLRLCSSDPLIVSEQSQGCSFGPVGRTVTLSGRGKRPGRERGISLAIAGAVASCHHVIIESRRKREGLLATHQPHIGEAHLL